MPKAVTRTTTTKVAAKAAKAAPAAKEEKAKRPPSAYNVFMKETLTGYKAEHPDLSHKDAFKAVAALWKDAAENPNRGQTKKKSVEDKENATSKPKAAKAKAAKKKVVEESDDSAGELGSDE